MASALVGACFDESDSRNEHPGSPVASSLITPTEDTSKIAKRGSVYKRHNNSDIPTFDPHTASPPSWQAVQMGYSRLTQIEPGYLGPPSGEVMGDLAESWELSPDKLQLTFRLRSDALIAPVPPVGARPIDAQDVTSSWQRYAAIATNRALLANAIDPSSPVVTVQSTDPRTVVFKLSAPSAALLAGFANVGSGNLYIVPKEADSSFDPRRTPIGSGPFYLSEYNPSV
jgi:ABC-type transport system substrate-binding protein